VASYILNIGVRNMKTFIKFFAGLLVLLVIAAAGFLYTFDANSYKHEIAGLAEAVTGRPISIAGDMDISLYPWIGIKVNEVTIENSAGFSRRTFATIGQLDVSVKIVPLLQKRLEIDRLVLHRLAVNFEKNAEGKTNWSDISGASGNGEVESRLGLAGLSVGRIDLKEARLGWLDAGTGRQFTISKMSLATKAIVKGEPLPLELKALVENSQPEWVAAVNAKTELVFRPDSAVVDAKGLKLGARALLPDSEIGKIKIAMVADSSVDLQTHSAKVTNAKLGLLGLVMAGTFDVENLFSSPVVQGPVKVKPFEAAKLAEHLKLELPQLANPESLKSVSLAAKFKTDFGSVHLDDITAEVDQSQVSGYVHVAGLSEPVVQYELQADRINLDDYMPVADESGKAGALIPLDFVRAAALDGLIDIETAVVGGIEVNDLQVTSSIENGILTANPAMMRVHDGEVSAALRFDARETPTLQVTAEVRRVDADGSLNPLLTSIIGDQAPVISGQVDADINLSAIGFSIAALQRSAKGTAKLGMAGGSVTGIDFNYASQSVVADYAERNDFRVSRTFNEEYVPDRVTPFESLNASFKIGRGRLVNEDFLMVSKDVNVNGSGSIDFVNRRLDYRPEIDMHAKKTGNIRDKLRDHPMMYHAHGPFGAIRCDFDLARYDLHLGRLMIQEAKAHRNRQINKQSQDNWQNALSK
jgi:AsmA protein